MTTDTPEGWRGEVFAAWLIRSILWAPLAGALYGGALALIVVSRSLLDDDVGIGGVTAVVVGAIIGLIASLPFAAAGGVTIGLTAMLVTGWMLPIEDHRRYSLISRAVAVITAIVTAVVLVITVLVDQGGDLGQFSFADAIFVFGPLVAIVGPMTWLALRPAVEKSLDAVGAERLKE